MPDVVLALRLMRIRTDDFDTAVLVRRRRDAREVSMNVGPRRPRSTGARLPRVPDVLLVVGLMRIHAEHLKTPISIPSHRHGVRFGSSRRNVRDVDECSGPA